jgi:hypothetical protein
VERHNGRAGDHGARVLAMSGVLADDEPAPRRGKVAVRDVDRDALIPLGTQAAGRQHKVSGTTR